MNFEGQQWVLNELNRLEEKMILLTQKYKSFLSQIHRKQLFAAKNMLKYLLLRSECISELQDVLHIHGLSSLASAESHIHRQLQTIQERLGKKYLKREIDNCSYEWAKYSISQKTSSLFGKKSLSYGSNIMVTFDASFADNYPLVKNLIQNGMNVARINCAHDNEEVWSKMIHHIKRATKQTGINCKIYMDLAGPKIRVKLLKKGKKEGKVKIKEGSLIWLAQSGKHFTDNDIVINPNESGIFDCLRKNERVYIDDGIIKGVIEEVKKDQVAFRIVRVSSESKQIKNNKGINFPDTKLTLNSLTEDDIKCIPFICNNADMIGYSFVHKSSDIEILQTQLRKYSKATPHIIIKIETSEAVANLPSLILAGMKKEIFGVMIARGDLAIEVGFERMGELQEEIIWICESAHVPVIWATQVLDTLNKFGVATRSEITDAIHAATTECVMVNKGNNTIKVLETLNDIFKRMERHHSKKRYTFRSLSIARNFINKN